MIYLAWFIFAFSILQLLVVLINLIFIQGFHANQSTSGQLVSVMIPARNEEKNIGQLLHDLQNQDYQNIEVLVFNDQSTDKTAEIVEKFAKTDNRFKLLNSDGLPDGWLGKNHACHNLSHQAKGKFFLFLDADVRVDKRLVSSTLAYIGKHKISLLSIFPKQIMHSIGEWLTVPLMNYILLSLLPLILVRKSSFPSLSAANGQFMLFCSEDYRKHNPHQHFKQSKVEDIEIARYYKSNKYTVACLASTDLVQCRMYSAFSEAANGFSKNVIHFFGNSFMVALLFWLITTFGFAAIWHALPVKILIIYLSIIVLTHVLVSIVSKQDVLKNMLLMIPQQFSLGLFIYRAIMNKLKKQYQWKGRNILSQ